MDAKEAEATSEKSRLQVILKAIQRRAEQGYKYLELFHFYPGECGGYESSDLVYNEEDLQVLRSRGYKISEVTERINEGSFFRRDMRTYAWHTITWNTT